MVARISKFPPGKGILVISVIMSFNAILWCRASSAQGLTELEFILSCNPVEDVVRVSNTPVHPASFYAPGFEALLTDAIRFYQLFISTQDVPSCNFVPSCSQFGRESIRRLGVLRGVLLTSDRLQRCNSMSTSRYQIDYRTGKLTDPVQLYYEVLR